MARLKPIHPGEILREEFMAPLRLNANKLALALHVPAPTVYDIVHEERGISPEMALRLGRFFRNTPDFWLNLQSEFDLRIVRNQKEATVKSQVRPLDESAWVSGSSRTMVGGLTFETGVKLRVPDPSWFSRGRRVCFFWEGSQNPDPSKGWKSRPPEKPKPVLTRCSRTSSFRDSIN
jgi:antitoxin HigA-1